MFKIIAFLIITLFVRLYMRVDILLTRVKYIQEVSHAFTDPHTYCCISHIFSDFSAQYLFYTQRKNLAPPCFVLNDK